MADAGGKKPRGLSAEQWAEVRKAYESGEAILALSKRFGVRRETIHNRRDRECWVSGVSGQVSGKTAQNVVREKAQAQVIDLASRRVLEQVEQSGLVAAMASELLNTVRASQLASEYAVELLTKAKSGGILPAMSPGEQTIADVFKSVMSGYKLFASTTREIAGLRPGQATIGNEHDETAANAVELFIVDTPTGTEGA